MTVQGLKVTRPKLSELTLHPRNPHQGDVGVIAESLEALGQYRAIVVQKDGMVVCAGNHTVQAARILGWDRIDAHVIDVDDQEALRILTIDNRSAQLGIDDSAVLANILKELAESEQGLLGTGFDGDDLDSLIQAAAEETLDHTSEPKQRRRSSSIVTVLSYADPSSWALAFRLGWLAGASDAAESAFRVLSVGFPTRVAQGAIAFIDNDFKDYDHNLHVEVLRTFRPSYGTTRDIMTKRQCDEAGIVFYDLATILEQAEEIAPHVENVMLIPKFDCIEDLPERIGGARVVLGYSVKSSYGQTPLHLEAFADRPTWLLGGSWAAQRKGLDQLGEAVVGLDNNMCALISKYGSFWDKEGQLRSISDHFPAGMPGFNSVALLLSLSHMRSAINENYGTVRDLEPDDFEVSAGIGQREDPDSE